MFEDHHYGYELWGRFIGILWSKKHVQESFQLSTHYGFLRRNYGCKEGVNLAAIDEAQKSHSLLSWQTYLNVRFLLILIIKVCVTLLHPHLIF